MKTIKIVLGIATVVLIVVFSATNPKRPGTPTYNVATEIRTRGVVQEVQESYCPVSAEQGIHLRLNTDAGTLQVHVAPARFLRSQQIRFNSGDRVEVLGSRFQYGGSDALLAREITRGEEVFILRDHQGNPQWQ